MDTIVDLLHERTAAAPDARAYTFLVDGEEQEHLLTYAALEQDARAVAARLLAEGAHGERVLLLYPPGPEFLAGFFGCLYAGAIAVPAYPPDPARLARTVPRLHAIVADCGARFVLTTGAIAALASELLADAPELRALRWLASDEVAAGDAALYRRPELGADAVAFLQYTSGSTGTPRGVMVTHRNLLHNQGLIERGLHTLRDDVVLGWLPLYHDMGLIGDVLHPLYLGVPCVLLSPLLFLQQPLRWLRAMTRYRATVSGGPNFAYELCARKVTPEQCTLLDLASWRVAFCGAEPICASTLQRFADAFASAGFRRESFSSCYGLAEATLLVSGGGAAGFPRLLHADALALGTGRVAPPASPEATVQTLVGSGRPIPDDAVRIVSPQSGCELAPGEIGEIWIASPSVARGYWGRPEESAATFGARLASAPQQLFLRTGDLGALVDGELVVTGRLKDLIIVRGSNHYPQDVELSAERAHGALRPGCGAAFAVDQGQGEGLALVYEVDERTAADLAEVAADVRRAVADEHGLELAALVLVRRGTIPKTSSGKIQRHAARAALLAGELDVLHAQRAGGVQPPLGEPATAAQRSAAEIEDWLLAQIAAATGLPQATVDAAMPFASFGIDSLTAVRLTGELESWLGRRIAPTIAWDYPTIRALARHLAGEETRTASSARGAGEPIAIIGVGCRLPRADGPEAFWDLLRSGGDAVGVLSEERRVRQGAGAPAAGRTTVAHGAFLDGIDLFDAAFFAISPREARRMDPQQRILLEVCWQAIEDAALAAGSLAGSATGVFVGISSSDYYAAYVARCDEGDVYDATGSAHAIAANRVSFALDLRGPSIAVDTACSSSLVAVHLACQSLRRGECSLALAGGVNLALDQRLTETFARAHMLAKDGRCKTFDAAADGYVRGEGAAVVVLKRLAEAQRDGDRVLAVVRGSAVNQDGRSNGLTAPNGPAQEAVIRAALDDAGLAAEQVSYVEAHGTGTALGDPIELRALAAVLGERGTSAARCLVGSVKTNIGHLEAAAGVAGLVKTVLALRHEEIPPHLHLRKPNPHLRDTATALEIVRERRAWPRDAGRARVAGVSSFGFGGTNAHVIVAEAPARPASSGATVRPVHCLPLSAPTTARLRDVAQRLAAHLRSQPGDATADVCFTAGVGRAQHASRAAVIGASPAELAAGLDALAGAAEPLPSTAGSAPRVAFVFTGEDVPGPDQDELAGDARYGAALEEYGRIVGSPLRAAGLEPGLGPAAVLAHGLATVELLRALGVSPAAACGAGIGECTAACVAGVVPVETALRELAALGREHAQAPPAAFAAGLAALLRSRVGDRGPATSAAAPLFVACRPGAAPDDGAVPLAETARALAGRAGGILLEITSGSRGGLAHLSPPTGTRLVAAHDEARDHAAWRRLLRALGALYAGGVPIAWAALDAPGTRRRVALPTYPFARESFWVEGGAVATGTGWRAVIAPGRAPQSAAAVAALHPLLDELSAAPSRDESIFVKHLNAERDSWLESHRVRGQAIMPAAAQAEMALAAARYHLRRPVVRLKDLSFRSPLLSSAARGPAAVEIAVRSGSRPEQALVEIRAPRSAVAQGSSAAAAETARELVQPVPRRLDSMTLRAASRPEPGAGEVAIEVRAAGLNFRDVMSALGFHEVTDAIRVDPDDAIAFGWECAGRVVAVGSGVDDPRVGDEVVALAPRSFATFAVTDARLVVRKPEALGFVEAATLPITFLTASYALEHLARLTRGERVLIHAGAGGVGLAAIALAQRIGAEIFTTAGSAEKRAHLSALGVAHVLDSRSCAFADEIRQRTDGHGVDVVLNSLAGEAQAASLAIVAPFGRFVEIGKTEIHRDGSLGLAPFAENLSFFGVDLYRVSRQRPLLVRALLASLVERFGRGELAPLPHVVVPFGDAARAFRDMAQRRTVGKIVLVPNAVAEPARTAVHATITAEAGSPGPAGAVASDEIRARCPREVAPAELYAACASVGIDYGEAFRCLRSVHTNGREVVARVELPAGAAPITGCLLHPILLDGALQALAALIEPEAPPSLRVPTALDELEVFAPLSGALDVVAVRRDDGPSRGGDVVADLEIADPHGRRLARLHGLRLRRALAPRAAIDRCPQRVVWRPLPAVGAGGGAPTIATCLLLVDGLGVGDALATRLEARGTTCVRVAAAERFAREGRLAYRIRAGEPADYAALLQALAGDGIRPDALVHLWACTASEPALESLAAIDGALDQGLRSVLHLARAGAPGWRLPDRVLVASTHGRAAADDDAPVSPTKAALHALTRTLAREHPSISCADVALDARGATPSELAGHLDAELTTPAGESPCTVAYRGAERFALDLEPWPAAAGACGALPLREGGVYLVTGGQSGIGFEIARFLASRGPVRLALVNRSQPDAARLASLRTLERAGVEVQTFAADCADLDAMTEVVARIRACWGPIDGVVHAAGVLRDGSIASLDRERLDAVLRPKVAGTWVLDRVTRDEPLAFFVLFSSLAALLSPAGQANHAAANAFLDAFAQSRARTGRGRTISINWGPWGESGVVATPRYRAALRARGLVPFSNADGVAAFARALTLAPVQIALFAADATFTTASARALPTRALPPATPRASTAEPEPAAESTLQVYARIEEQLDRLCAAHARRTLAALGVTPGAQQPAPTLAAARELGDARRALLARLASWTAPDDCLTQHPQASDAAGEPDAETLRDELLARFPECRVEIDLLEHCASHLPAVLRGALEPIDVLFPGGSPEMLTRFYDASPLLRHYNRLARDTLRTILERRPERPLKILEIGAGTGATTTHLLSALTPGDAEYLFTDVSPYFFAAASRRFADGPRVRCRRLDIERDLAEQGFAVHDQDVVVAANVLHATARLRETLHHVRSLLAPGGVLLLLEPTRARRWLDLTFGLTDGWWRFRDHDLRADGPLLSASLWRRLLAEHGFTGVEVLTHTTEDTTPMALIVATAAHDPAPGGTAVAVVRAPELPAASQALAASVGNGAAAPAAAARLADRIRAHIGRSLRVAPHTLSLDGSFADIGLDSLMGMEVSAALEDELAVAVPPTLLFDHPSIGELAAHLATLVGGDPVVEPGAHAGNGCSPPPASQPTRGPRAARPPDDVASTPGDVAVIGIAGRFPSAPDLRALWGILERGEDVVREIPAERWDWRHWYDADPRAADKSYSRWGGFVDDVASFDPLFFNVTPREARLMDPQQRLFLETSWRALESAGYGGDPPDKAATGVFVGCSRVDYLRHVRAHLGGDHFAGVGNMTAIIPNRVSFFLGLRGPSLLIDTLCSSSLVAVHLACQSLLREECAMALAGGVNLLLAPEYYVTLSRLRAHSPQGRCRAFDHRADGFVSAEGVGAVVLKRLDRALADRDPIYAVLKGSAVNHDGRSNGLSAPNPRAQVEVIEAAYRAAGISPASTSYVEAHGTGTELGDPIEVEALERAFRRHTERRQFCSLASIKTNLGHTEAASGIAGLLKVILALQKRTLPPSLHFERANPLIHFATSPFRVQTELAPWQPDGPRIASVSSFGLGGANAHLVVAEAPQRATSSFTRERYVLPLSARSGAALATLRRSFAAHLAEHPELDLGDLCFSASVGTRLLGHRAAFVARDRADLLRQLDDGAATAVGTGDDGHEGALARRHVGGERVDFAELYRDGAPRRVALPEQPFERMRCWLDAPAEDGG